MAHGHPVKPRATISPLTARCPCNVHFTTQVVSPLLFPSSRHENRAVQAVEVRGAPRSALRTPSGGGGGGGQPSGGGGGPSHGGVAAAGGLRSYTFTFCLERVLEGPLKAGGVVAGVCHGRVPRLRCEGLRCLGHSCASVRGPRRCRKGYG